MWDDQLFVAPSLEDRRRTIEEHLVNLIAHFEKKNEYRKRRKRAGEPAACHHFRSHLVKYLKGQPGIGNLIKHLQEVHSMTDVMAAVDDVLWSRSRPSLARSGA